MKKGTAEAEVQEYDSRSATPVQGWPSFAFGAGEHGGSGDRGNRPVQSRTPTPHQWARDHALRCQTPPCDAAVSSSGPRRPFSAIPLGPAERPGLAKGAEPVRPASCTSPRKAESRAIRSAGGGVEGPGLAHTSRSRPPRQETSASRPESAQLSFSERVDHHFLDADLDEDRELQPEHRQSREDLAIEEYRPCRSMAMPPSPLAGSSARGVPAAHGAAGRAILAVTQANGVNELYKTPIDGCLRPLQAAHSQPSRLAAPRVRPHNAWCTFVEWTPPADGDEEPTTSYDLKCFVGDPKTEESAAEPLILRDLGRESRAQLDGLEAGQIYFFQVRRKNFIGEGPWSIWSEGYEVPLPPKDDRWQRAAHLPTSSTKTDSVTLEWDEPCSHGSLITGYKVQYGVDPDDESTLCVETAVDRRRQLEVAGLFPNRCYFFRVKTMNDVGESEWTGWYGPIATMATVPELPEPPTMQEATPEELVLRWIEPATCGFPVLRWDVKISEDPSMEEAVEIHGETSEDHTLRMTDLTPNTAYFFQLRAWNAMGASMWSAPSSPLKTESARPSPCENLHILENYVNHVVLGWEVPETSDERVDCFLVCWAEDPRFLRQTGQLRVPCDTRVRKGDSFSCDIKSLEAGEKVFFRVAARTRAGVGLWSETRCECLVAQDRPSVPQPPIVLSRTAISVDVQAQDTAYNGGAPVIGFELRFDMSSDMLDPKLLPGLMTRIDKEAGPPTYHHPVTGLFQRGPYFFSCRAVNKAGRSPWSACSIAVWLPVSIPSQMSSPSLHLAEPSGLWLSYVPPADLGATQGGRLEDFEMRWGRSREELLDESRESWPDQWEKRWPCPEGSDLLQPAPVRVLGLRPGRKYYVKIRAVSVLGCGRWSDVSEAYETLPSAPVIPRALTVTTGTEGDPVFGCTLRCLLPECNGKPIELCHLQVAGPFTKYEPGTKEPRNVADLLWNDGGEFMQQECDVQRVSQEDANDDPSDPTGQLVWFHTQYRLTPGSSYAFRYRCFNEAGWSDYSRHSELVHICGAPPDRVEPPSVLTEEAGTALVEWAVPHDGGSEISHYTLKWSYDPNFEENVRIIDDIKESMYTWTGLDANRVYFYCVAASNKHGQGRFSHIDNSKGLGAFRTHSRVPSKVLDIKLENVPGAAGNVDVCWTKPEDDGGRMISRYTVIYSLDVDFKYSKRQVSKTLKGCRLVGLCPDAVYYFKVLASNSVGEGAESEEPAVLKIVPMEKADYILPRQPLAPGVAFFVHKPEQPKNPPPSLISLCEVRVSWLCPEKWHPKRGFLYEAGKQTHAVTHYSVRLTAYLDPASAEGDDNYLRADDYRLVENFVQERDRFTAPTDFTNHITFKNLRPGRFYYAEVQAFSEAGASGWSPAAMAEYAGSHCRRAPPDVPDQMNDIRCVDRNAHSLTLEWEVPIDNGEKITRFVIQYWKEQATVCDALQPTATQPTADMIGTVEVPFEDCVLPDDGDKARQQKCRYCITNLVHAQFYTVEIGAANKIGDGKFQRSPPLRTNSVPPGEPGVAYGVPGSRVKDGVTFAWSPPTDDGGDPLLRYDVCWIRVAFEDPVPRSVEAIVGDAVIGAQRLEMPAVQLSCPVRGLGPGEAAIPVVRAWNCQGHSGWSALPREAAEIVRMSALPGPPSSLSLAPLLEMEPPLDHRPYALTARWQCPSQNGAYITKFIARFDRVGTRGSPNADGSLGEIFFQLVLERPGSVPWQFGEEIAMEQVHTRMVAGADYAVSVRAASEAGEAEDWGTASAWQLAPPDLPREPDAPDSPWQWPTAIELKWSLPEMCGGELEAIAVRYSTSSTMDKYEEVAQQKANEELVKRRVVVDLFQAVTLFYFQVRVKNSVGWSPWSVASAGHMIGACRPGHVEDLAMTDVTQHELTIRWAKPDDHGMAITEYELILCEQRSATEPAERLADCIQKLNELGNAITSQSKRMIRKLPAKAHLFIKASDFAEVATPTHTFNDLVGGLDYTVTARAKNDVGWSDWCHILGPIKTSSARPAQVSPLVCLESTTRSLRCQFRLPYDSGEAITRMALKWVRIQGPIDRHIALGGADERKETFEKDGAFEIQLPSPGPAPAPVHGQGGASDVLIEGLEPGAEYEVRLCAINRHGPGPFSLGARMICSAGQPDAPRKVHHSSQTDSAADSGVLMVDDAMQPAGRPVSGQRPPPRGGRVIRFSRTMRVASPMLDSQEEEIMIPRPPPNPLR
eukprot:TRINITY_DN15695_c0_g1_i1.p1 TRINITY_DN15695_c0_g1~~TRINITY_DN15695_c0_g1_i1.p1  ORF type:complete len:2213 (+),score=353.98 TRINITY_DN15695_c0_g1_i1:81-6719(+)